MSSYTCIDCGKIVNISRLDIPQKRCPDCSLLISKSRYDLNIDNGITLFANTGDNLGHKVITEALLRFYVSKNSNEKIYYLSPMSTMDIEKHPLYEIADKIFWADVSNIVNAPKDKRVIHYYLARECSYLAGLGFYPEWKNLEPIDIELPENYIVLHLRNVHGNPEKNVTSFEAQSIYWKLVNFEKKVFIVGNDMPFYDIALEKLFTDLRGKLSVEQVAWLMAQPNCKATIGKDSGPLHLAAAVGCPVIAYGYQHNRYWIPKGKNVTAFTVADDFESFLNSVFELK